MLPKKHFDRIEKEALDMTKSTTDSIAVNKSDAFKSKKVIDIKENAIEKSAGATSDNDEYEYDYNDYYDDNDNYTSDGDDIITVTPKSATTVKRTFNLFFYLKKKDQLISSV